MIVFAQVLIGLIFKKGVQYISWLVINILLILKMFNIFCWIFKWRKVTHFFIVEIAVKSVNLRQISKLNRKALSTRWITTMFLWKSSYQNRQSEEKEEYSRNSFFQFLRRTKMHCKKQRISICLFNKNR